MFKKNDANFFRTSDNEQLFYIKNFYEVDPSKPVLVFNYGLVCSKLHWQFQAEYFDQLGYQIIIHDYRGHFQSTGNHAVDKITFKQLAEDVYGLCQFLKVNKAIMIGHSMGVNVCLQLKKDYPELVLGMVLISGTFVAVKDIMFDTNAMEFLMPIIHSLNGKYPELVKKAWSSGGLNPLVRNFIHSAGFNKDKVSKEFIEIYMIRVGQLGIEIFLQLFEEMARQNIAPHLESMNVPALVIGGQKDNVIPNHLQRQLAELMPMSETYFLKDGSHVPQADFPEYVNERITLFLNQHFSQT